MVVHLGCWVQVQSGPVHNHPKEGHAAKACTVGVRYQPPGFWSLLSTDGADGVMLSAMVEVTADGHRLLSRMLH